MCRCTVVFRDEFFLEFLWDDYLEAFRLEAVVLADSLLL